MNYSSSATTTNRATPGWQFAVSAFGSSLLVLVFGSYFMQTGVQGAFGVIPAHLNELSPDAIRSLFPGFVYQLGVLLASPAVSFEYNLRDHLGYPWALTAFAIVIIVSLLLLFGFGPERLGRSFYVREDSAVPGNVAEQLAALKLEAIHSPSVLAQNSQR